MTDSRTGRTAAVSLPGFLSTHEVGTLSVDNRRLIVQQALLLLEQNYALLPFKVARYGINPLQRLRRIPGANPDARHVRAVDRFTFRALGFGPPPDEELLTEEEDAPEPVPARLLDAPPPTF